MNSSPFSPSWAELGQWFSAVEEEDDPARMEKIADIQESLKNVLYEETGHPFLEPPADYRRAEVTLSPADYQEMRSIIGEGMTADEQNQSSTVLYQWEDSLDVQDLSRSSMNDHPLSPSWAELGQWFSAVEEDFMEDRMEKIADMQDRLKSVLYEETGHPFLEPPADYRRAEVTLSPADYQEMRSVIGEGMTVDAQNRLSAERHHLEQSLGECNPSRAELHQWHQAAYDSGDDERVWWITGKGIELRDLFREESGHSEALPPDDYRHPDLRLSAYDHAQMCQTISPTEPEVEAPKKQMELD